MSSYTVVWRLSNTVNDGDAVYPCRQVYVWLVTKDNQVVIVSKDGKHWQLPGGKPEVDESLVETAVREVREETGLDITASAEQITTFGYYVVDELGAEPSRYLQIRCILNLPVFAEGLALRVDTEDDSQPQEDVIRYVRSVPFAQLSDMIPWMPQAGEYPYIVDALSR